MASSKYRPSGKVSFSGILYFLIFGTLFSGILMIADVYGMALAPNLAARFGVYFLTLFLFSRLFRHLAKRGKYRSGKAIVWMTVILLLLLYYIRLGVYTLIVEDAWVTTDMKTFISTHMQLTIFEKVVYRLIDPLAILKTLGRIISFGFWSLNGRMMTGVWLILCWVIELLSILIVSAVAGFTQSHRLFDEDRKQWLDQQIDFTIGYIRDHRILRRQLLKGELEGLSQFHSYKRKGKEAYGTITFYHHKGMMGPFVTIKMIKAVQIGPKKIRNKVVPILDQWNIGDHVEILFKRILEEQGTTLEKITGKNHWKERQSWNLKKEQIQFAVHQTLERTPDADALADAYDEQEAAKIEEVTVYTPSITPEMEQEYLARQQEKAQREEWKANKESLKSHRNKSKRRSTRIR